MCCGDFCLWLQAEVTGSRIYVRSTPSFGHSWQGWECLKLTRRRHAGDEVYGHQACRNSGIPVQRQITSSPPPTYACSEMPHPCGKAFIEADQGVPFGAVLEYCCTQDDPNITRRMVPTYLLRCPMACGSRGRSAGPSLEPGDGRLLGGAEAPGASVSID